jgi:hypothetical protein
VIRLGALVLGFCVCDLSGCIGLQLVCVCDPSGYVGRQLLCVCDPSGYVSRQLLYISELVALRLCWVLRPPPA